MDYIPVCEDEAGESAAPWKVSLDRCSGSVRSEWSRTAPSRVTCVPSLGAVRRTAPDGGRAQVRRLDREAPRQRHCDVVAAARRCRGLQPRAQRAAAGVHASRGIRGRALPTAACAPRLPAAEWRSAPRRTRVTHIAVPSPAAGTVVEKMAVEGMPFTSRRDAVRIDRHVVMWVLGRGLQQDLAFVKVGDMAKVVVNTWPDRSSWAKGPSSIPRSQGKPHARLRIESPTPTGCCGRHGGNRRESTPR